MGFVANRRKGAWIQGARREGDAGILDDMSSRPIRRNAVDMRLCADAVESHEISGLIYQANSQFVRFFAVFRESFFCIFHPLHRIAHAEYIF